MNIMHGAARAYRVLRTMQRTLPGHYVRYSKHLTSITHDAVRAYRTLRTIQRALNEKCMRMCTS